MWRIEVKAQYGHWVLWRRVPTKGEASAERDLLHSQGKSVRLKEEVHQ